MSYIETKKEIKIETKIGKIYEEKVKEEIERKGLDAIKSLSPSQKNVDSILKIMKEGDKEFTSKVGREMTYSEMREMYG
jgi:hypothetical protein